MRSSRSVIPAQDPPGFDEVSMRLKTIIDRSHAIDEQLQTLEALRDHDSLRRKSQRGPEMGPIDRYRPFCEEDAVCLPVPPLAPKTRRLSESNSRALCEIMDVINDLRKEVANLATRQNEMKAELDRIRGRLC